MHHLTTKMESPSESPRFRWNRSLEVLHLKHYDQSGATGSKWSPLSIGLFRSKYLDDGEKKSLVDGEEQEVEGKLRAKKGGLWRPLQRFGHWLFNDHPDYTPWRLQSGAVLNSVHLKEKPRSKKEMLMARQLQRFMHFVMHDHPNYELLSPHAIEQKKMALERNTLSNRTLTSEDEDSVDGHDAKGQEPAMSNALPSLISPTQSWWASCLRCVSLQRKSPSQFVGPSSVSQSAENGKPEMLRRVSFPAKGW